MYQTTIEERPFKDIYTWMPTGQKTNLPDILKGIFFMDGNDLPDDCLTLNSTWDAETLTLKIPVFAPEQWTFHPSEEGRRLLRFVEIFDVVYKIKFQDNTLRHAIVVPTLLGLSLPRWITEFTMTQTQDSVNGETWNRRNTIFFGLIPAGGYILRKVVDSKGQKTETFDKMLAQVQATCLVVAEPDAQGSDASD